MQEDERPSPDQVRRAEELAASHVLVLVPSTYVAYCLGQKLNLNPVEFTYLLCWAREAGEWVKQQQVDALLDKGLKADPAKVKHRISEVFREAYKAFRSGNTRCTVSESWGSPLKFADVVLPRGTKGAYMLNLPKEVHNADADDQGLFDEETCIRLAPVSRDQIENRVNSRIVAEAAAAGPAVAREDQDDSTHRRNGAVFRSV